jgi:hypothetical protein
MKYDAAIDLAAEYDFFPRAAGINRRKYQVIFRALDLAHEAVHNLGIHSLKNPGVICIQQPNSVRATARKCSRSQIGAVPHLAGEPPDTLGCFGTSAMRFLYVASQNPRDG